MTGLLSISIAINLIVLSLVIPWVWIGTASADSAYGLDSEARRIVICVYAAIWLLSAFCAALMVSGQLEIARSLAISLLAVQIIYKFGTVFLIGTSNPVVMSNLLIALFHGVTLWSLLR